MSDLMRKRKRKRKKERKRNMYREKQKRKNYREKRNRINYWVIEQVIFRNNIHSLAGFFFYT